MRACKQACSISRGGIEADLAVESFGTLCRPRSWPLRVILHVHFGRDVPSAVCTTVMKPDNMPNGQLAACPDYGMHSDM